MLHNVKKYFILTKIQMLFSENPDVYVKKQVQIRTQRSQITLKHICLFLSFFQSRNLLHSVTIKFARHNVKSLVYKNKKKLKGSEYLITESLTKTRKYCLRQLKELTKYGVISS